MAQSVLARLTCLGCSLLTASCGLLFGDGNGAIEGDIACLASSGATINNGPLPAGCIKTEGGDHGQLQSLVVGGSYIEFTGWISKDDKSEGEYVGFTYNAPAGTFISIKAGGESHIEDDDDGVWTHPNGTYGPEASAISNIVICEPDDENNPMLPDGDQDGDGLPNNEDDDGDNDGVPDVQDGDDDNDGIPDNVDDTPHLPARTGPVRLPRFRMRTATAFPMRTTSTTTPTESPI
jgi:hypothetical protein